MKKLPDAMIITDPKKEYIAIKEASKTKLILIITSRAALLVFAFMYIPTFFYKFLIE